MHFILVQKFQNYILLYFGHSLVLQCRFNNDKKNGDTEFEPKITGIDFKKRYIAE